jgi:hypothetical protein
MIGPFNSWRGWNVELHHGGNLEVPNTLKVLFVTLVTEVSLISRARTSDLRESLYLEDFSENRSVLFPSALDTIAEEDSSRVTETSRFRTALFV